MEKAAQPGEAAGGDVSKLLRAWSDGDQSALERLTPIVYDELHRLARRYMKRERPGHSLKPRPWSMKPTCGWWIMSEWIGRIEPIVLLFRPSWCDAIW